MIDFSWPQGLADLDLLTLSMLIDFLLEVLPRGGGELPVTMADE